MLASETCNLSTKDSLYLRAQVCITTCEAVLKWQSSQVTTGATIRSVNSFPHHPSFVVVHMVQSWVRLLGFLFV